MQRYHIAIPMTAPNAGVIDTSQSRSYAFVREDV